MKNFIRVFSLFLTGIFLIIGFVFLLLSIGQYDALKGFLDQLTPDGTLESFTQALHSQVRIPLLFFGGTLFILGGVSATFRNQYKKKLEDTIKWIPTFTQAVWEDAKEFFKMLLPESLEWWEWLLLTLVVLLAIAGRWVLIEKPMGHDEAYTFIAFARYPFRQVISDYHLPNNHIFNSVLIHFLYKVFGNPSAVIVRFPAFFSGILLCISGYFFTRREYGKWEALAFSIALAVLPWLKDQSANGRGYMLMALFTLWMVALAIIVKRSRNRFAWLLLILVTVLNFWTLPVALYPFGIIATWLLVSALIGDISDAYDGLVNYLKYFIGYGVSSGIITFLLHTPIFLIGSGWNSFFNNPFVSSLTWNDFRQSFPIRLAETGKTWSLDLPLPVIIFFVLGIVLFVGFRRNIEKFRVSMLLVTLVVLAGVFIVQKPNPWPRTWTYLLPLVMLWCVMGWFAAIRHFFKEISQQKTTMIASLLIVAILMAFGIQNLSQNLKYFKGEKGQAEVVALWLKDELTEEDFVFTSMSFGPAYWYYFDKYGMPMDTVLQMFERDWKSLYLIVDDRDNDSYQELLVSQKPVTPEECPPEIVESVYEYGHFIVYRCDAPTP